MPTLIFATLLLGSLPALLSRWQHALLGAATFLIASMLALAHALRGLGAEPGGGDGPAFATLIILFGCAQTVVVASIVGRAVARWLARSLTPSARARAVRVLLYLSTGPLVLAGVLVALDFAVDQLMGISMLFLSPVFWFALALQLAPDHALKPKPPRIRALAHLPARASGCWLASLLS